MSEKHDGNSVDSSSNIFNFKSSYQSRNSSPMRPRSDQCGRKRTYSSSLENGNQPQFGKVTFSRKKHASGRLNIQNKEDARKIEARKKQIQYGKNTIGYDNYLKEVPKCDRKSPREHPRTPDPYERISKRAFDGQIRVWRRQLHKWDPNGSQAVNENEIDDDFEKEMFVSNVDKEPADSTIDAVDYEELEYDEDLL